jgi:hypothetical protein
MEVLHQRERSTHCPTHFFPGSLVLQPVSARASAQSTLETLIALLEPLQTKLATDTTLAQFLYAASDSVPMPNWSTIRGAVQTGAGNPDTTQDPRRGQRR